MFCLFVIGIFGYKMFCLFKNRNTVFEQYSLYSFMSCPVAKSPQLCVILMSISFSAFQIKQRHTFPPTRGDLKYSEEKNMNNSIVFNSRCEAMCHNLCGAEEIMIFLSFLFATQKSLRRFLSEEAGSRKSLKTF